MYSREWSPDAWSDSRGGSGLTAGWATCLVAAWILGGCAHPVAPDPTAALRAYSEAARQGNARVLYGMLSDRSRRDISFAQFERMIGEERAELNEQARAVLGPRASIRTTARVRSSSSDDVTLEVEQGDFRIRAIDGLPLGATTPEQALAQLRRALASRSYAALLRVLSPRVRASVEADLRSLVDGLSEPDALDVKTTGDTANVIVEGGHSVRLRRHLGNWKVEDFD